MSARLHLPGRKMELRSRVSTMLGAEQIQAEASMLAAEVTPQKVLELLQRALSEPGAAEQRTVSVLQLMRIVFAEKGYDHLWQAKLALPLSEAIRKAVARIPGLRFVEGG